MGAGTIILTGRKEIKGLTTAAGLWASACMGLAIGAGFYSGVLIAFLLVVLCIKVLPLLEDQLLANAKSMNLYIEVNGVESIGEVTKYLREQGITLLSLELYPHNGSVTRLPGLIMDICLPQKCNHEVVRAALLQLDAVCLIEEM